MRRVCFTKEDQQILVRYLSLKCLVFKIAQCVHDWCDLVKLYLSILGSLVQSLFLIRKYELYLFVIILANVCSFKKSTLICFVIFLSQTCAVTLLKNVSTFFPFIECIESSKLNPGSSAPAVSVVANLLSWR